MLGVVLWRFHCGTSLCCRAQLPAGMLHEHRPYSHTLQPRSFQVCPRKTHLKCIVVTLFAASWVNWALLRPLWEPVAPFASQRLC